MSPRSHFRSPGSHLVILRSWVRMALFRYALIYNCSVVDKGYQKNLKNQVYHISSIYKYYYARKTTFRGNSEKTKKKQKKTKGCHFTVKGCQITKLVRQQNSRTTLKIPKMMIQYFQHAICCKAHVFVTLPLLFCPCWPVLQRIFRCEVSFSICDILREKGPTTVKRRFKRQLTAFSLQMLCTSFTSAS